MAVRITLRKSDLVALAAANDRMYVEDRDPQLTKLVKQWDSFYSRVLAAVNKPKASKGEGVSVRRAIDIFRGVLGRRLVEPAGNPAPFWFIQLQNKLNASGITEELAKKAAEVASVEWKGSVKVQSIINQADLLLSAHTTSRLGADLKVEAEDMSEL